MTKILSLSTAILMSTSLMAGAAFAQTTVAPPAEPTPSQPAWMSDAERGLYEQPDTVFGRFYTDETFTELQPEDEFETSINRLAEEDVVQLQRACEDVAADPGSYSAHTQSVCVRAGYL